MPTEADERHDPPGPDAVARRLAVLVAVSARGFIEVDEDLDDKDDVIASELAFYDVLELGRDAEPDEEALIRAPGGTLAPQAAIDAVWRAEGMAVLAWALGHLATLPPFDETADLGDVARALDLPWSDPSDVRAVRSPHLRLTADLHDLDTQLLTAHWRVRQFGLDGVALDYVSMVPTFEWAQLSLDGLAVADGDLAIGGDPIAEADPDHVRAADSILRERRLAVSWLLGCDPLYSEGDTDT